jgi:sterol desaturase/sphingolipid hydroxylase (fatty acid hydroxylase superfamily)
MQENNLEKWYIVFCIGWGAHIVFVIFFNLVMCAIYCMKHPFIERYKIEMEPWPWQESAKEWRFAVKKSIGLVALNVLVALPALILAELKSNNWQVAYSFELEKLPNSMTLLVTLIFCMLCEDFGFHLTHRFLHWKVIYPHIHKIHHTHVTTIGITSEYMHPIEFIFSSCIPFAIGPLILGPKMHYFTYLVWGMIRISESIDGHCGYDFSWSPYRLIPFSTQSSYHNYHHTHNIGNYSSFFYIWDSIFGSNANYYKYHEEMMKLK